MKEFIQQVVRQISTLPQPVNPEELLKILTQVPLDKPNPPTQYSDHLVQLILLKDTAEAQLQLNSILSDLREQETNFNQLSSLKDEINIQLTEIKSKIEQITLNLSRIYNELLPHINTHLKQENALAPEYAFTDNMINQRSVIAEHKARLESTCKTMDLHSARFKLVPLKTAMNDLIKEIRELGVICSADNSMDRFSSIISSVTKEIKTLTEIQPRFTHLQTQFARQMTLTEIQTGHIELAKQYKVADELFQRIQIDIDTHVLDKASQERLIKEFEESKDREQLVQTYSNQIDSVFSNLNPLAWVTWYNDENYTTRQNLATNSVSFLQLLQNKERQKLELEQCTAKQKKLNTIISSSPEDSDGKNLDSLVDEANQLFEEFPSLHSDVSYNPQTAAEIYLELLANIPLISTRLEQRKQALEKLNAVALLDQRIDQLRTAHALLAENDGQLPSMDEVQHEASNLEQQTSIREALRNQLDLCKLHKESLLQLLQLQKEEQQANKNLGSIQTKLQLAINQPPNQQQKEEFLSRLKQLQTTIIKIISELCQLPLADEISAVEPLIKKTSPSDVTTPGQLRPGAESQDQVTSIHDSPVHSPGQKLHDELPGELIVPQTVVSEISLIQSPSDIIPEVPVQSPVIVLGGSLAQSPIQKQHAELADGIIVPKATVRQSSPVHSPVLEQHAGLSVGISVPQTPIPADSLGQSPVKEQPVLPSNEPVHPIAHVQEDQVVVPVEKPSKTRRKKTAHSTTTVNNGSEAVNIPSESPHIEPKQLTATVHIRPPHSSLKTPAELPHTEPKQLTDAVHREPTRSPVKSPAELPHSVPKQLTDAVPREPARSPVKSPAELPNTEPKQLTDVVHKEPARSPVKSPAKLPHTEPKQLTDAVHREPARSPVKSPIELPHTEPKQLTDVVHKEPAHSPVKSPVELPHTEPKQPKQQLKFDHSPETYNKGPSRPTQDKFSPTLSPVHEELSPGQRGNTLIQGPVLPIKTPPIIQSKPPQQESVQHNSQPLELSKWNIRIQTHLPLLSGDFKEWYKKVLAKGNLLQDPAQCTKLSNLLIDILFELEHKKDSTVLDAYMRICPDPTQDLESLLSLKSALPAVEDSFNEDNELNDCPEQLKKHYQHYLKLKANYPMEAELLLQAIRSVRMVLIVTQLPNSAINPEYVPSLSRDPRFEPLKRHRGFLKIWEMLEDFCRSLVGKLTGKPEYEYTKRPCFFNTRSAGLLEEADSLVKNLLPGASA